jgi:hypothetical protein
MNPTLIAQKPFAHSVLDLLNSRQNNPLAKKDYSVDKAIINQ